MIITCSIFPGFFFHLPNKPGWDFQKCLKCFSSTYLWLLSRIKMFSKSPGDFKCYGLNCISGCFWFLHTWSEQLLSISKMDSKTSCLHYARSKIACGGQNTGSHLGKMNVQHLLQTWLLIYPFEGLLLLTHMWISFLLKHTSQAFFVYFYLRSWKTFGMQKYQSKQKFLDAKNSNQVRFDGLLMSQI